MAVTFYNLGSEAGLKKLDEYLLFRSYITGYQASKDDLTVHSALSEAPSAGYVNVSRWYNHIDALLRISGVSREGCGVVIENSTTEAELVATSPAADAKMVNSFIDDFVFLEVVGEPMDESDPDSLQHVNVIENGFVEVMYEEDPKEGLADKPEMGVGGDPSSDSEEHGTEDDDVMHRELLASPGDEVIEIPAPVPTPLSQVAAVEVPVEVLVMMPLPQTAPTSVRTFPRQDTYAVALDAAAYQAGPLWTNLSSSLAVPSDHPLPVVPQRIMIGSGFAPHSGCIMEEVLSLRGDNEYLRNTLECGEQYVRSLERDVMYYKSQAFWKAQPVQISARKTAHCRSGSI